MRKQIIFAFLSFLITLPAAAGSAPLSCRDGTNGCWLESDILVFAEGDPVHEITAKILNCTYCSNPDPGNFQIEGLAKIEWGPYDPTLCSVDDGSTELDLNFELFEEGAGGGGPGGNEKTYIPFVDTEVFHPDVLTPLRPDCVLISNLDYEIPWVELTGGAGATSGVNASGDGAYLDLPESVRAEEGGSLLSRLPIEQFGFTQALTFSTPRTDGPSSTLRFWPDGLPFKLGPYRTTFTEASVSIDTDLGAGSGPPPYTPFPPRSSNLTTVPGGQVIGCDPNKPDWTTEPCNSDSVSNGSYLDSADWMPSGTASFDNDGLDVVLDLPLGSHVTYETLFPRGVWARLEGPATVTVGDSAIVDGSFNDGTAWLRIQDGDLCGYPDRDRTFPLSNDYGSPEIGAGGSLMAGIEDLTAVEPVDWAVYEADFLECGTLYTPPILDDLYPQISWHESAVPTVLDRGVYAGINYNRDKVCHDSVGSPLEMTCTDDSDCDTGSGEYCADGGFSPLCGPPGGGYDPVWRTEIEGEAKSFPIDPTDPVQGEREMAFVARKSGITGVFDGGDEPFDITNGNGLTFHFDSYGLAFRQSRTPGQDTIVRGGAIFPWPADTTIPFEEMKVCNCGTMGSGKSPDLLVENNLLYWNATFFPYGLQFTDGVQADGTCPPPGAIECSQVPSLVACITALTPIPRLKPDPTSLFPIMADGTTGTFTPLSQPRLKFDEYADPEPASYTYDIESFVLNHHPGTPPGPSHQQVVVDHTEPYGHYEISGDLLMPYFGLTPAGLQVMSTVVEEVFHHPVNLYEEGNLLNSFVVAARDIAGDTVPLEYKVDYFTPGATAFEDGTDIKGYGRGSLFAFADESVQDLGAVHVAGGMIMNHEEIVHDAADLGPAAAMRLWGATEAGHRDQLENIIPTSYVFPYAGMYTNALNELVSERPYTADSLPDPVTLKQDLHDTGAIDYLETHDHAVIDFNAGPSPPSPPVTGSNVTGVMQFSTPDPDQVEWFRITSDQSTGGEFYAFEGSVLQVDRHVKQSTMPISTLSRESLPGASQNMAMPGEQSIAFPGGGGGSSLASGSFFPGIDWDIDYEMPNFQFKSITGSLDLTKGGLSGVGFDELCATLKFYADGDWYFDAGVKLNWSGYSVKGGVLLGNTVDMTPLQNRDPDVADFLYGVTQFDGGYLGLGISANAPIVDYGCFFRINVGAEVAGWYISESFGGKVRGFVIGDGVCLVSIRGDMTLIGGEVNDAYRLGGHFWAAGGIGFCDPEDWNTPADVLDDDFCGACVFDCKAYATWPPEDVDIKLIGPDVDCAL